VCGRTFGQSCGGVFSRLGSCDTGLVCVTTQKPFKVVDFEAGVCGKFIICVFVFLFLKKYILLFVFHILDFWRLADTSLRDSVLLLFYFLVAVFLLVLQNDDCINLDSKEKPLINVHTIENAME
jgi:hypothetical protein